MWKIIKKIGSGLIKGVIAVATALAGVGAASSASPYKPAVASNVEYPKYYLVLYEGQRWAIPSNAIPSNAIPSNAIPSNAIPSNAIPSNAIPSNAIPSNALPAQALPAQLMEKLQITTERLAEISQPSIFDALPAQLIIKYQVRNDAGREIARIANDIPVIPAFPPGVLNANAIPASALISQIPFNELFSQPSEEVSSGKIDIDITNVPPNIFPNAMLPLEIFQENFIPASRLPVTLTDAKFRNANPGTEAAFLVSKICQRKICDPKKTDYYVFGNIIADEQGNVIYAWSNTSPGTETANIPPQEQAILITATPPLSQASSVNSTDRCDVFDSTNMRFTYQAWEEGKPLVVVITMTGGVPGLEKKIAGDTDSWNYSLQIEDYQTTDCQFYEEYREKLICNVTVEDGYGGTFRSMELAVNGCDLPIYAGYADVPSQTNPQIPSSANSSSGETVTEPAPSSGSEVSCGPKPNPVTNAWCSCKGGVYKPTSLVCGGGECATVNVPSCSLP